jgi:hypothetical protein
MRFRRVWKAAFRTRIERVRRAFGIGRPQWIWTPFVGPAAKFATDGPANVAGLDYFTDFKSQ